jgi:hypothetical protein
LPAHAIQSPWAQDYRAFAISAVEAEQRDGRVEIHRVLVRSHEGNPRAVLAQGEPFWMRQAFGDRDDAPRLLCPTVNLRRGYEAAEPAFLEAGQELGFSAANARQAFRAYSPLANKGIPKKLTSRGQTIIPFEMLPFEEWPLAEDYRDSMHGEAGQRILRAAEIVRRDDQLFGIFITNFLCAPDSFIVSYFRRVMEEKPSLTLELDEHTADAGINTRIEAFLDIMRNYLDVRRTGECQEKVFRPAQIISEKGRPVFVDSSGKRFGLRDRRITMLLPSMGQLGTQALARIPLTIPYPRAPRVELTGEIFARWDPFSNLRIAERLARKGFVVKIASIAEWPFYTNFQIKTGFAESRFTVLGRIDFLVSNIAMWVMERKVKRILSATGMDESDLIDIEDLMRHKRHIVPDRINGEHDLGKVTEHLDLF